MRNIDINNSLKDITVWFRSYRDQRPLPEPLLDKAYKEMCELTEKWCKYSSSGDVTKDTKWVLDYAAAMMMQLTKAE